ncbi:hypothetical protein [Muribaculum intestinale]|uniref:Uncharacterized protein n=1 Tax=Muribaculum intestinale TaxID=1796646 RepID=A0A4S2G3Y1_9BACT|nr:hypothetical protein [Muribaculum intestinale]MYM13715.1 hypothetical protein [Muribaculum intestinale]TGX83763.1 hypothetical protein E5360_07465 [Muribaculum intestinale]TGY76695.1 hypothetical protein E5333_00105 [Muribaculum intestinale]
MQQSILFKVPGQPSISPALDFNGHTLSAKYSTPGAVSRTLSSAWNKLLCACAPRRILRTLFSPDTSLFVATLAAVAVWWHIATLPAGLTTQHAVAVDCLIALPWAGVATIRSTVRALRDIRKGGAI